MAISRLRLFSVCILAAAAFGVGACSHKTQTTSGEVYLQNYPDAENFHPTMDIDEEVRRIAAVEPTLRFPARIGLARIGSLGRYYGIDLLPIPEAEGKAWAEATQRLGPQFGEFVPISPLVAEMLTPLREGGQWGSDVRQTVEKIRLAAARQHVDAVLIYQAAGTADTESNPLSVADWTLLGAFILPGQDVEGQGIAQALLLDVRNGYPYGSASAVADDSGLTTRFTTEDAEESMAQDVASAAALKLVPEVEAMFRDLQVELAALDQPKPAQ